MSNIRPVQFKPEINESLVEILETVLSKAKRGELVSGNFVGTTASGDIHTSYSASENALLEIAAAARLLHRLQVRMDDNAE